MAPEAEVPLVYQLYLWRKKFGIGWFEAMTTPFEVIRQDLEIMGLEEQYGQSRPAGDKGKTKKRHI